MDYIEYNGEKYPVRTICLKFEPKGELLTVLVSVESLSNALEPFERAAEEKIDEAIYFYVADENINLELTALTSLVAGETDAFAPSHVEIEAWKEEVLL